MCVDLSIFHKIDNFSHHDTHHPTTRPAQPNTRTTKPNPTTQHLTQPPTQHPNTRPNTLVFLGAFPSRGWGWSCLLGLWLLAIPRKKKKKTCHAATEPRLGMLDMQYHLRTQPGRVRCSTCRPGELRGCRREHGSHWGRRDTVPLKVQGQLKGVDQEVCLQLICKTGQRPENQITTLGLVPRQSEIGRTSGGAFQRS